MLTTFRYTIRWMRGQILAWGLGIAILGLILVSFYDIFLTQQSDLLEMVKNYPPEFLAFFGGDATYIATPEGYLTMYGFSMLPVIIGIFAVLAGSGLLARDEEGGQLDLIVCHPVSRTGLFVGRLAAFAGAAVAICLLGWLGFAVLLGASSLEVSGAQMALPFVALLAQTLIFGALALLLSMITPSRRMAAAGAGLVLVTSYFLSSLAGIAPRLASISRLLPYDYYQGGEAINGLDLASFLGLMAASAVLSLLAWWRFERRDIRVAGEGGWRLPSFSLRRRAQA
jgi:ABC-2 type transport system permease protein